MRKNNLLDALNLKLTFHLDSCVCAVQCVQEKKYGDQKVKHFLNVRPDLALVLSCETGTTALA